MDKKKILIVGAGNLLITDAVRLASQQHEICILHDVVDSQFTEPKEENIFKITKLPEMWIDPKEPVFNQKKRKKRRKKRKRR